MYVILIAIMLFFSIILSGFLAPPFPEGKPVQFETASYKCCDSGDGKDCHPGKTVTFNGEVYGLMKSDIYVENITDGAHFDPAPHGFIDGQPVFVNIMPGQQHYYKEKEILKPGSFKKPNCNVPEKQKDIEKYKKNFDWVIVLPPPDKQAENPTAEGCYEIPNDMLIYKCREDSPEGACTDGLPKAATARFDVYIRLSDIPDGKDINSKYPFLTKCVKRELFQIGEGQIRFRPSPEGQNNLQLRTFSFMQPKSPATWVSPWCKPAIYLYPEKKTEINVSVFPQGKMLLTIPPYPKLGWDVVAESDGAISYQNRIFDYLYYEASIPDELIEKPKEGYLITYEEREMKLKQIVEELGLNEKETKQFVEYWAPILPKSPYYFVGIIPVSNLNRISPLLITPQPETTIRISLFFEPLQAKRAVTEPLILPIMRKGFTAVEWGGIVKRDKNHAFSCFM